MAVRRRTVKASRLFLDIRDPPGSVGRVFIFVSGIAAATCSDLSTVLKTRRDSPLPTATCRDWPRLVQADRDWPRLAAIEQDETS